MSGAVVPVKAKLGKLEAEFKIYVEKDEVEVKGSLFEPIEIENIPALKERDDFIMGADISSIVEVLKRGGKFYDPEGRRTSIFKLLRDAGVNYIRIRLWNDPKALTGRLYGGGNNDLEVAKRIGRLARAFDENPPQLPLQRFLGGSGSRSFRKPGLPTPIRANQERAL